MAAQPSTLSIIRASAGSGKTHRIKTEYVRWVLNHREPVPFPAILALTFTNKAAYEMKERILDDLEKTAPPLFRQILANYELFSVSTLDAFYQRLIQEFLHELGLSAYRRLEIDWQLRLPDLTHLFFRSVQHNRALQALVTSFLQQQLEEGQNWNIERLIRKSLRENIKFIYEYGFIDRQPSPDDLKQLVRGLRSLKQQEKQLHEAAQTIATDLVAALKNAGIENDLLARRKEWQLIRKALEQKLFKEQGRGPEDLVLRKPHWDPAAFIKKTARHAIPPEATAHLETLRQTVAALYLIRRIRRHFMPGAMMAIAAAIMRQFKSNERILFLADAPHILTQLLSHDQLPFVYEKMGVRYRRLIIDEFQDTSRMQWDVILPMVDEALASGGEVVLVGDQKQSIYGWRGAESHLMSEIIRDAQQRRWRLNTPVLERNWRSTPDIIDFNNRFFQWAADLLKQEAPAITATYRDVFQKPARFRNRRGYVTMDLLPSEEGKRTTDADTILDWTVERLREGMQAGIPLQAIMILIRDNREARKILQRLLNEGIPAVTPSSFQLTNLPAIQLMLAVLRMTAYPADASHHSWEAATLWHRLDPDLPLEQAHQRLMQTAETIGNEDRARPLQLLRSWAHRLKWHTTPTIFPYLPYLQEAIHDLLKDTDGALETLLDRIEQRGETIDLPLSTRQQAVRILTIHKAKGLDAEMVIVPNATWGLHLKGGQQSEPLWFPFHQLAPAVGLLPHTLPAYRAALPYVKGLENILPEPLRQRIARQKEAYLIEQLNLLYVAFTRARFILHVAIPHRPRKQPAGTIRNIGDLLAAFVNHAPHQEWGNRDHAVQALRNFIQQEEKEEIETRPLPPLPTRRPAYPGIRPSEPFTRTLRQWRQMEQGRRTGTAQHRRLQKIITIEDLPPDNTRLRRMLSHPDIAPYYAPDLTRHWDLANEYPLMDAEGRIHILDRILWHKTENRAVVIDYKLTPHPRHAYIRQVEEYMKIVHQQSGRAVSGFLIFPDHVERLRPIP